MTAYDQHYQSIAGVPPTADQPPTMLSVTQGRPKNRIFGRRSRNQSAVGLAGEESEAPSASGTGRKLRVRKGGPRRRKTKEQGQQKKSNRNKEFAFKAQMGMDILGITMIEVKGAKDLPKWKNSEFDANQ